MQEHPGQAAWRESYESFSSVGDEQSTPPLAAVEELLHGGHQKS